MFTGWDGAVYINEEEQRRRINPGRTVLIAVALLTVVYFVATAGLQGVVSPKALAANAANAPVYIAQVMGGAGWAKVMALSITLSAIALVHARHRGGRRRADVRRPVRPPATVLPDAPGSRGGVKGRLAPGISRTCISPATPGPAVIPRVSPAWRRAAGDHISPPLRTNRRCVIVVLAPPEGAGHNHRLSVTERPRPCVPRRRRRTEERTP